jgi:hypothetical protein
VSTTSDLSPNKGSINGTRYFEITTFIVKAGHRHDFEQLTHMYVDMYVDVYRKVAPDGHWDCFEVMYRNPLPGAPSGGAFVVVNTMKSQAEANKGIVDSENLQRNIGSSGMQKIEELSAASFVHEDYYSLACTSNSDRLRRVPILR